MKTLFIICVIIPFMSFAQEKGVNFEDSHTWEAVLAKAKTENKLIFVNFFSTTDRTSMYMLSNVLSLETVGDFLNTNFVNVNLQTNETEDDSQEAKLWQPVTKQLVAEYNLYKYPMSLIFNPDGELLHRIAGGAPADQFIAIVKSGLNPEKQYATFVKKFDENPSDLAIAKTTAYVAAVTLDTKLLQRANSRVVELSDTDALLTAQNIDLLLESAGNDGSTSTAYKIIKDNTNKVNELLVEKNNTASDVLASVLVDEAMKLATSTENAPVDFIALEQQIAQKHTYVDITKSVLTAKLQYYSDKQNWLAYKDAVNEFIGKSNQQVSAASLNTFAWSVFKNSDDPACLQAALAWSKKSLEENEDPMLLDTYANLLYKSGDKENAIKWQETAVAKVPEAQKESFIATLDKMKKGLPTWE